MSVWAFIPARGGSKSITKKNLARLGGLPLINYGVNAVIKSGAFERVICSTDDFEIANHSKSLGIEVDERPNELGLDSTPVADVLMDFLSRNLDNLPDYIMLIQPTSPFITSDQIKEIISKATSDPKFKSAQTIYKHPHNFHAWNQRVSENGLVRFFFEKERKIAYNKQSKPALFVFGNLILVRSSSILNGEGFFATPSLGIEIEWPYNLDVDGPNDLLIASIILENKLVELDEMSRKFDLHVL